MHALLIRLKILLSGLVLVLSPSSWAVAPLEAARADTQRFPEDYGAWVALARMAEGEQAWDEAAAAWTQAAGLSGGSVESQLGQARVALALDDRGLARAASEAAVQHAPQLPYAWQLRAEALRRPVGAESEAHAWAQAHKAARQGFALDPADPYSRCELAWSRWRVGDSRDARRLFDETDHPCAETGRSTVAPRPSAWAALWGGLQAYPGSSRVSGSRLSGLALGGSLGDRLDIDGVGRMGRLDLSDGLTTAQASWRELWTGVGLRRGHSAASLVLGGSWTDLPGPPPRPGEQQGPGPLAEGERSTARHAGLALQAGNWPTVKLSAALSAYDDGQAWQAEAGLRLPTTAWLDVDAGLRLGAFTWVQGDVLALSDPTAVDPTADGRLQLGGRLGVRVHRGRLSAAWMGRLGPELRPVQLADRIAWPLNRRIQGAVDAALGLQLSPTLGLQARYTGLRLPAVSATLDSAASLHSINLGLSARIPGQMP